MAFRRLIAAWLPFAIVITALSGLVYVVAQQSYRMGANDIPTQVGEDAAAAMGKGLSPAAVVGSGTVDIAASLSPFVGVFDGDGVLVASSARLDGRTPVPPKGVLAAARTGGVNKVTWQPKPGVRIASVAVLAPGDGGNVVFAGQSLREAETHIGQLGQLVGLGALATLIASLAAVALGERLRGARP